VVRHSAKSFLTWFFAIAFGGMSIVGDGLHDLLGLHPHESAVPVCSSQVCGSCYGDSLADGPSRLVVAANHRESCHDSATCPICQYLAQGRVAVEQFQVVSVTVNVPNRSALIPLFVPGPYLRPFQARAPPAV